MHEPRLTQASQYSPLRYYSGKGKIAKFVKGMIRENNLSDDRYDVEPYAGVELRFSYGVGSSMRSFKRGDICIMQEERDSNGIHERLSAPTKIRSLSSAGRYRRNRQDITNLAILEGRSWPW